MHAAKFAVDVVFGAERCRQNKFRLNSPKWAVGHISTDMMLHSKFDATLKITAHKTEDTGLRGRDADR